MYCSSCGTAVAVGLSYCNYCGAKLSAAKNVGITTTADLFPDSLVWAIVTVFIVGLGCIIGLMAVMKDFEFSKGSILGFTSLLFLLTLVIEGVFIGMLLGRKRGAKVVGETKGLKSSTTTQLGPADARTLPEPVPSVTEHHYPRVRTTSPRAEIRQGEMGKG